MTLLERINQYIAQSIETQVKVAEEVSTEVAKAAETIAECLLSEHKLLICGDGTSGAIAQIFTSHMIHHFEQERPSLPALCLCANNTTTTAIAKNGNYNEIYAKQIRALGFENDILFNICSNGDSPNSVQAVQAAHERNLQVITLTAGDDGGNINRLLGPNDIEIRIPSNSKPHIHESHLLIVHCLLGLIDTQLFGLE